MRQGDVETNLPQIVAIQCKEGCLFPIGEVLFKTLSLIYWTNIQHVERMEFLKIKLTHELNVENLAYFDNVKLLSATLDEAVRRYKNSFNPT
jgi:phosphoribosylformylglycinamidine (FGAM) synthase PurS component